MPSPLSVVERRSRLPVPIDEAFAWHERPGALERLTPPWERVDIVEHGGVKDGARAVLRLRAGPVAVRWVALHRNYVRNRQFVDEQVEGPFSRWVHLHRFEPDAAAASAITDRIEFAPPLGALGGAAAEWLARPRIERLLAYRHRVLQGDLAAHARHRDRPRLHVAMTGATGLIGSALAPLLTTGDHRVTPIVRGTPRAGQIGWDPSAGRLDGSLLEGVDAVIHLAGENVGARWTDERKRRIVESRVGGTRLLAETLSRLRRPPRVFLSASAVGIYGDRGDQLLTESSSTLDAPQNFFVELGREWESATEPARAAGIRVVHLRFGIVLTPAGGALGRMLLPFRLGVGGRIGSGRHWVSWIAVDDAIGAVHHALFADGLSGPLNVSAPHPVTNRELSAALGAVLRRPAVIPVPPFGLRIFFGEMVDVALLASHRMIPRRLIESGYVFRFPELTGALRHVLGIEAAT